MPAADAFEGFTHRQALDQGGRRMAGGAMHLINRSQPPGERRGAMALAQFAQIKRHRVRRGGERGKSFLPAPVFEMAPVGAVGAQGGLGFGGPDVLFRLAGQARQFGRIGSRDRWAKPP